MSLTKTRVAVLISGSGSNLQALIDAASAPDYPAQISCVISNTADAYGLVRAKNAGIPTHVISHKDYPNREAFDSAIHEILIKERVEFICLAGFMRLLSAWFIQQWPDKILNIHPSLLPAFKGAHAQRDALAAGATVSGCTVHYVIPEMDAGPIIAQASVPVLQDDTEESLKARILKEEHRIYPDALRSVILQSRSR